jgi:hypothetical protein
MAAFWAIKIIRKESSKWGVKSLSCVSPHLCLVLVPQFDLTEHRWCPRILCLRPVEDCSPRAVLRPHLTAAAGLMQSLAAVTFMTEGYLVKPNDIVLVHTVSGGPGLQLAQYAKSKGARVVGTTSTKEKAELAKRCAGVDWVVLYKEEDTVQRVLEITNGEGVDAIFDGVGKDTLSPLRSFVQSQLTEFVPKVRG